MNLADKVSSTLLVAAAVLLACNAEPTPNPTKVAATPAEAEVDAPAPESASVPGGTPKITADEAVHDFGPIKAADTVEHVFKIRNAGDADLKIDRVQKTWGCTATVVSNDVIPPGGEGEIKVTLHPKGTQTKITKNIQVFSNDPEQAQFTLTVEATLLVDMIAQPPMVSFLNLAPGEAGTAEFSVQLAGDSAAEVKSVRAEDPAFSVREVEAKPGALATYEVRFAGRDDVGTSSTNIIVETTGPNTPELKVPARASAAFNLRYPKRVGFRRRGTGPLETVLRISTRRGDAPKIKKIDDPDGLLEVEIPEAEGPVVAIQLRVRDDAAATADTSVIHKLFVHTNDPDEPKLEIEYQIMPQGPAARVKPQ